MKPAILLHPGLPGIEVFRAVLAQCLGESHAVAVWPTCPSPERIVAVIVWLHTDIPWETFPALRRVLVCGAGIDALIDQLDLPVGVDVIRLVDPNLRDLVADYVIAAVLNYQQQWSGYRDAQQAHEWTRLPRLSRPTIGFMGLGLLGEPAALKLEALGFATCGWVRREAPRRLKEVYVGADGLAAFARRSGIVVCLLPLTLATRGILGRALFEQLPRGAYVINVGRGEHLVEAELLDALAKQQLSGACLDVFSVEPLPTDHPFWDHPSIRVTPHIAGRLEPTWQAAYAAETLLCAEAGSPRPGCVDRVNGY